MIIYYLNPFSRRRQWPMHEHQMCGVFFCHKVQRFRTAWGKRAQIHERHQRVSWAQSGVWFLPSPLFIIHHLLFIIYYLLFIIYHLLFIIYYWLFIIDYVLFLIDYLRDVDNDRCTDTKCVALSHTPLLQQSGSGAAKVTSASSRAQNRAFQSVSAPGALQAKMRSATWRSGSWMHAFDAVCGRGAPDAEGYILLYEQTLRAPRKLRSLQGKPWLRERHERHRAPRTAPRRTACGKGVGAWAPCGAAVRFYEGEEITSAPQRRGKILRGIGGQSLRFYEGQGVTV